MSVWKVALAELSHRRLNAALAALAIAIAVAACLGAAALLRWHDVRAEALADRQARTVAEAMAKMEDDYRKITLQLGFNVMILPKDQKLADLYAEDYAARTMPEDYVARLAASKLVTLAHIMPSLQQKVVWPERQRTMLLVGTRGELPADDGKKPLQAAVAPGTIVLGYELHAGLAGADALAPGGTVRLMGREFEIAALNPQRGTKDDITAWIDLGEAQALLDKPGLINAILALQCHCALADLPKVREELAAILPDTQVIEFRTQALARAESRWRAARTAQDSLAAEAAAAEATRRQRRNLAALLIPLVIAACGAWVALLTFTNVRERRAEIGLLRAVGLESSRVLVLFLARSVILGLLGAAAGAVVALAATRALGGTAALVDARWAAGAVAGALLLAILAAWPPARLAATQDPADILREA